MIVIIIICSYTPQVWKIAVLNVDKDNGAMGLATGFYDDYDD